jgi:hypothetical protein
MNFDNNLTGIISANTRKEKDTHPDINGECEINGTKYWINGWKTVRKDGRGSFYKLRFKPKEARQERRFAEPKVNKSGFDDMQNDIPW